MNLDSFNIKGILPIILLLYFVLLSEKKIFSCSFRRLFKSRIFLFIMVYLAIFIYLENKHSNEKLFKLLGISLIILIIFILTTKSDAKYTFIFLILNSIVYFIDKYLYDNKNFNLLNKEQLNIIRNSLFALSLVIFIIGLIKYFIKKKGEYKKDFSLLKFFIGKEVCKSNK
jgi:hypothetical protein